MFDQYQLCAKSPKLEAAMGKEHNDGVYLYEMVAPSNISFEAAYAHFCEKLQGGLKLQGMGDPDGYITHPNGAEIPVWVA
ncbi:MAG TPA: hypothetical protein VM689_00880 [Aliidongia sp.]|nr:hypothetical protein [Aliidongia sp.]